MRTAVIVATVVLCGAAATAGSAPTPNRARMEADVRALADDIGPRLRNTAAATRAADEIERRANAIGFAVRRLPVGEVRSPEIRVAGRLIMAARTHRVDDDNLVVEIEGATSGPAILIMAHYDTVENAPGAVDNASGVAVLLELGRLLREHPPSRPVILAWTASEEFGLVGARALARDLGDRVGFAIAIDLLGAADTVDLNGLSNRLGAAWLSWLAESARAADVDVRAPIPQRVISRALPAIERSDHGAFTERGIPAVHLYSRGPERIYLDYHSPQDTTDRVAWPAIEDGTRLLFAITQRSGAFPVAGGDPGMWLDLPGGARVISWAVLVGVETLLLWIALAGLVRARRRRAPRTRGFARGLFMTGLQLAVAWTVVAFALRFAAHKAEHVAPWVHAPGRFYAAAVAIAIGVLLLTAWALRGRFPSAGRARYLAMATSMPIATGIAFIVLDAPELALPCMIMAACLGAVGLVRRLPLQLLLLALALWPLSYALDPALLREATYHGFLPAGTPLWPGLALLTLPHVLATVFLARSHPAGSRRWKLIAPICGVLLLGLGFAAMTTQPPRCDGTAFRDFGLRCERGD